MTGCKGYCVTCERAVSGAKGHNVPIPSKTALGRNPRRWLILWQPIPLQSYMLPIAIGKGV
jgi:hypothetical protein